MFTSAVVIKLILYLYTCELVTYVAHAHRHARRHRRQAIQDSIIQGLVCLLTFGSCSLCSSSVCLLVHALVRVQIHIPTLALTPIWFICYKSFHSSFYYTSPAVLLRPPPHRSVLAAIRSRAEKGRCRMPRPIPPRRVLRRSARSNWGVGCVKHHRHESLVC